MKLKFSLKDIKKNIAGMTPKEAAGYLWTYYKWHILIAAFLLYLSVSLASAVIGNALSQPVLKIGVMDQVDIYLGDVIDNTMSEAFPGSTGHHAPLRYSITSPASENNPYGTVQLMAYLSAGELDVVLADRATADYMAENGAALRVVDISGTKLGKNAETIGISPLLYVIVPNDTDAENRAVRQEAAEHLLEVIQDQ